MNSYLVIDCSFVMAGMLPDESNSNIDIATYNTHVPSLFYLECISVLRKAVKQKRISLDNFEESLRMLSSFPFIIDNFSTTSEALRPISKLCQAYNLSPYDASYLELAIRLDAKLGTYDQSLLTACKDNKIKTL